MKNGNNSGVIKVSLATIVVIAIVSVFVVIMNNAKVPATNDIIFDHSPPIEGQPMLGDENAPVTVYEFGDFKCPACKAWGDNYFPQLITDYIEAGKVNFVYINVLFHGAESTLASLAAEAVLKQSPESYWEFHMAIYDAQPDHQSHDDLWVTIEKLLEIASTIPGIDIEQLQESLENNTEIAEVEKDHALVKEYQVQLTPTIMVNTTMLEDPFDYEKIKSLIEQELDGK